MAYPIYTVIGGVSIPYWLGSKLRYIYTVVGGGEIRPGFQSPIGWGLSCDFVYIPANAGLQLRFNPLLVGV